MKKLSGIFAILCGSVGVNAHSLDNTAGATDVVASYELSGFEIWHSYFMDEHRKLVEVVDARRKIYRYIANPPYSKSDIPSHRSVCDDENFEDELAGCADEFPHVHIDDFKMGLQLGRDLCASYGSNVKVKFTGPASFTSDSLTPSASHHFYYKLADGLSFDCVQYPTY